MSVLLVVLIVVFGTLFVVAISPLLIWPFSSRLAKKMCCRFGWHSILAGFETTGFDGCPVHARCKWCGYKGMIDSQGNLF